MSLFDKFKKNKSGSGAGVSVAVKNAKKSVLKAAGEEKSSSKEVMSTESKILDLKSGQTNKGLAYRVLERALVSEKSAMGESKGTYGFIVKPKATKTEIKKAIELIYGVKPVSVRVINMLGKPARFGRRSGQRKNFKKAIIRLPKGSTISVHEGV
mgnify:CR=1 FL=1